MAKKYPRKIEGLLRLVEEETYDQDELVVDELRGAIVSAARFWADNDLIYALRELSGNQDYRLSELKKALDTQPWKYDTEYIKNINSQ